MWILVQNEKRILSTEDMDEIYVLDSEMGRKDFVVAIKRKTDRNPLVLGFYQKKEHAMKVLKDVLIEQSKFYSCKEEEGGWIEYEMKGHRPS